MQARRHAVSVRLCVVHSVKTNKHRPIFEVLSLSGTHTILVFLYQTAWQYSDGNTPNGGVECRCGNSSGTKTKSSDFASRPIYLLASVMYYNLVGGQLPVFDK